MTAARVAVLTPAGRGAIASLLVEDNGELLDRPGLFSAVNGTPVSEQAIGRVCLGHWGEPPGEDVILCRTGPGSLELHCHGGIVPTQRITSPSEPMTGRARSVAAGRSPSAWLGERSTTTATTSRKGSRTSSTTVGSATLLAAALRSARSR